MGSVIGFYKKNGKTRPITRKAYRKNIAPDYSRRPLTREKHTTDSLTIRHYSADGYSLMDALTKLSSKANLLPTGDEKEHVEWYVGNKKVKYVNPVEEHGYGTFRATIYKNGKPRLIIGAVSKKKAPGSGYHLWHVDAVVDQKARRE